MKIQTNIKIIFILGILIFNIIDTYSQSIVLDTFYYDCKCIDKITPGEKPNSSVPIKIIKILNDTIIDTATYSSLSFLNKENVLLYKLLYCIKNDSIKFLTMLNCKSFNYYFLKNRHHKNQSVVASFPFGNVVTKSKTFRFHNNRYYFYLFDIKPQISNAKFFFKIIFDESFNIKSYGYYDSFSPFECVLEDLYDRINGKFK